MKAKSIDDDVTPGEFLFVSVLLIIFFMSIVVCGVGYFVSGYFESDAKLSQVFYDVGWYSIGAFFLTSALGHTVIRVVGRIFGR